MVLTAEVVFQLIALFTA